MRTLGALAGVLALTVPAAAGWAEVVGPRVYALEGACGIVTIVDGTVGFQPGTEGTRVLTGDALIGYESRCTLESDTDHGEGVYEGRMSCQGEGETWQENFFLTVMSNPGGIAQNFQLTDPEGNQLRFERCDLSAPVGAGGRTAPLAPPNPEPSPNTTIPY